jgi:hypothetical protein
VTGFPPGIVAGTIHAADSTAAQGQADLVTAYNAAAARVPSGSIVGDLAGQTFDAGVYHSTAAIAVTGIVTLDAQGDPNAVFIFQTDAAMNTAAGSQVSLINGALASHVYWQVAGAAGTGATSSFSGTILAAGAITLGAGTQLIGRALSYGTVTLAANTIRFVLPPTQLVITTSPSGSTGGVAFVTQPVVAVEDRTGIVVASDTSAVTLTLQSAVGATLTCAANPRSAVAGIATFNGCAVDKPGTYTLIASDGALTTATTAAFTITVGPAAKLAFTASPTDSFVNGVFVAQPVVTIQDAGGNTITSSTASVTLAVTGGTLACTANPKAAVAGVATFAGCTLNTIGTYTLSALGTSLTAATSASFGVFPAPTNLAWAGYSSTCTGGLSGTSFALVYHLCLAATFTASVSLTSASGTAVVNLGPDITVTLTAQHGSSSPTTLTIAHGSSVSSLTSTFTAALISIIQLSDRVTASATALTSATSTLDLG